VNPIVGDDEINVAVSDSIGIEHPYRVKISSPTANLMRAHCARLGIDRSDIRFSFDLQPLDESKTFQYYEIEDGDIIDTSIPQKGGKPVIMIYGSQDETVNVTLKLDKKWELSHIYPEGDSTENGLVKWGSVKLNPEEYLGALVHQGKTYPYLFWESHVVDNTLFRFTDRMICVSR
jgi:hypothetical protein